MGQIIYVVMSPTPGEAFQGFDGFIIDSIWFCKSNALERAAKIFDGFINEYEIKDFPKGGGSE